MLAMGVRRFYLRSRAGCAGRRVEIDAASKEGLWRPIRCLPGQRSLPVSLKGEYRCALRRHPTRAFGRGYPYASAGSPRPSRAFVGIPMHFFGHPHPARAFGRGYPYSSAGLPHPARASVEIPVHPLPATPAPPAPAAGGYPYASAGTPTPPAPSALLPRPLGGGVRAWRYQVGHRARVFSRISPCAGPWGYRHWGRGRRGGGTRSPSPVSHTPTILLLAGTPTPPAPPALLPRPRRGRGQCVAISGEQPCPGWSWWEVRIRLFPTYPHALDRGDIATGGGADGEGELVPPPLSPTLQPSNFSPPSPTHAHLSPGKAGRYPVGNRVAGSFPGSRLAPDRGGCRHRGRAGALTYHHSFLKPRRRTGVTEKSGMEKGIGELRWNPVRFDEKNDGPDAIRTHDLPVISRVHHRLCYGPNRTTLQYPP